MLPSIRTNEGVSVVVDNKNYLVRREHISFRQIMQAVNSNDKKKFLSLLNKEEVIANKVATIATQGLTYSAGKLYLDGKVLDNSIWKPVFDMFCARIELLIRDGLSVVGLLKFIENTLKNPSRESGQNIYDFVERNRLPLTEDGYFLAYKSVTKNYKDKYSGKIDNSVGKSPHMDRNLIDENRGKYCSEGLHVGALEYSGPEGWYNNKDDDRCIIVKVNPKDVVSVPTDHSCQKCRVSDYTVVADYESQLQYTVHKENGKLLDLSSFNGFKTDRLMDISVGDDIVFKYTSEHGEELRYLAVTEIVHNQGKVTGILNEPESNAGQYRCFYWKKMKRAVVLS